MSPLRARVLVLGSSPSAASLAALPSTSPAYTLSVATKLGAWREGLLI